MSRPKANRRRSPDQAALALVERLAFERLLADFAAHFADVPAGAVVTEIEKTLQRLLDFFGCDRCTYSEFAADGALKVISSAATPGIAPLPPGPIYSKLTWFCGELRAGRPVILPALPLGLPPHAIAETDNTRRNGVRSHLSIPLHVNGLTTGVLSFAAIHKARDWPEDLITRLTIIAQVFASAVARARSEEEAQQLRGRLWHADRVARVSALTAAIAHEINQPLTAILSNAQAGLAHLDRGDARPQEMRDILEAVVNADKRVAETIRTMRGLLRRDEDARERIDLTLALGEVVHLLAGELGLKGIRIELSAQPGCWVNADKAQIEQVVLNLLLNAAAAMESGAQEQRAVCVSVARTPKGNIAVEVRDAGVGIPAQDIEKVFEPFWTTRKEGLGLGLAICRSIVEAHGGAITVAPNLDRGVTFRFELAAAASAGEVQAAPPPQPLLQAPPVPAAEWPVVCVIDDDATVRKSVERLLLAQGWRVACYASANEFLERQPFAAVGCILLDNQMPGMSGLELQRHLAERGAAPAVVFLTGHGELATGVEAMKLGAVDFLVKPVEAGDLCKAVREALARHADERARAHDRETSLARLSRLTAREREVMVHVIHGRLNKQIAAELDVAIQTVKQHRSRVMAKMEVRSVADLVRACDAAGALPAGNAA